MGADPISQKHNYNGQFAKREGDMTGFPRHENILRLSASCLVLALSSISTAAFSQETDNSSDWSGNEIIVTATKRNESIQNVPFSINAQTAEAMQRMAPPPSKTYRAASPA